MSENLTYITWMDGEAVIDWSTGNRVGTIHSDKWWGFMKEKAAAGTLTAEDLDYIRQNCCPETVRGLAMSVTRERTKAIEMIALATTY